MFGLGLKCRWMMFCLLLVGGVFVVGCPSMPDGLVVDFESDVVEGLAPLALKFYSSSTSDDSPIVSWAWRFGDGESSDERNPEHTYGAAGTYDVALAVMTADDEGAELKRDFILVTTDGEGEVLVAEFEADVMEGSAPLVVQFTDLSTSVDLLITSWLWSFGDGETSTEQNPIHAYAVEGVYSVSLVVAVGAVVATEMKLDLIEVTSADEGEDEDVMAEVPASTFVMGDPWREGSGDEWPVHEVTLSAYQISRYEVSNQEYADILNWANGRGYLTRASSVTASAHNHELLDMDDPDCQIGYSDGAFLVENREGYSMGDYPVVEVSWYGAAVHCNWLSEREGLELCYNTTTWACDFSKNGYRLPTEAQWERAAAWDAALNYHYRYGSGSDDISCAGVNYRPATSCNPLGLSSVPYTSPVGFHAAALSPVGCYDMAGNVGEWCNDWSRRTYSNVPMTDPKGPNSGSLRMTRGGSWLVFGSSCRSADRYGFAPSRGYSDIGFRVVRQ